MRRPSYRAAVQWITDNDDTEDLMERDDIHPVSVCLVADLFGKTDTEVASAVRQLVLKREARRN